MVQLPANELLYPAQLTFLVPEVKLIKLVAPDAGGVTVIEQTMSDSMQQNEFNIWKVIIQEPVVDPTS